MAKATKTSNTKKAKEAKELYRYRLLLNTLDKLEYGGYTGGLDIYWCGNTIEWLWKWRKITEAEKNELCERVIAICEYEIAKVRLNK